jgi:hypothetical protein
LKCLKLRYHYTDIDDLEKETYALSDEADYRHALEYGEPQIKKKLKAFNQKIILENKEYNILKISSAKCFHSVWYLGREKGKHVFMIHKIKKFL